MRQVGAELAARERAADRMAEAASPPSKQLLAADAERIARARRALGLVIAPTTVFVWRQCGDGEGHMSVLDAAKFGALPAVNARIFRGELHRVRLAGDQVHLARQAWHPEAVNDVGRFQQNTVQFTAKN